MGEEKKRNGDGEGDGKDRADNVKKKAMRWLLTTREADRLRAVRNGAQKAFDDTIAEAKRLADELIVMLDVEDRIRTQRVFLPSDPNIDATIVAVTTGAAVPGVAAHAVDFVAGG